MALLRKFDRDLVSEGSGAKDVSATSASAVLSSKYKVPTQTRAQREHKTEQMTTTSDVSAELQNARATTVAAVTASAEYQQKKQLSSIKPRMHK